MSGVNAYHEEILDPIDDNLDSIDPGEGDSQDEIIFNPNEVADEAERWVNTLVVHVAGQRPYFHHFNSFLQRVWKVEGGFQVFTRDNGCFLIKFRNSDECRRILEAGPWLFDGRYIMMKLWQPNICLEKEILTRIPLWVRMLEFPLLLWSKRGLSRVASKIGKPLRMDLPTSTRRRLAYARVFVEVDAKEELRDDIFLTIRGGGSFKQPIKYEWKPLRCASCICFGHSIDQCKVSSQQKWIPKDLRKGAEDKLQENHHVRNKGKVNPTLQTSNVTYVLNGNNGRGNNGRIESRGAGKLPQHQVTRNLESTFPRHLPSRFHQVTSTSTSNPFDPIRLDLDDLPAEGDPIRGEEATEENKDEGLTKENPQWKEVLGHRSKGGKSRKGKGKALREETIETSYYNTRGSANITKSSKRDAQSGPGRLGTLSVQPKR